MKKFRDAAHAASRRTIIVLLLLCLSGILFASIFRAAPNKSQPEAQRIHTPTLGPSIPAPTAITLTVTTTNDGGPGSLRQALADAHDGDTIQFDPSLNGQTITLTSAELVIDKSITISGPGPGLLRVSRDQQATNFRILHIMPNYTVAISGLTISAGQLANVNGGGILNDQGTLRITNCAISGNSVTAWSSPPSAGGAGIYNNGTLSLANSTVSNNSVVGGWSYGGGGIYNAGTLTITQSSISSNSGDQAGGGIGNGGMLTISDSTVGNNRSNALGHGGGDGGGIANGGTLIIQNSSISGNTGSGDGYSAHGGGIANYGSLELTNSTVSGNTANQGGGIYFYGGGRVTNSTVSGNSAFFGGGGISGTSIVSNSTISSNTTNYNGAAIYGGGTITNSTISSNNAPSQNGAGIYASSTVELTNTILKAGTGANIVNNSAVISHGYNISSDNGGGFLTGRGDQINTDPILGPLQNNGGPTSTHALLPGSPAVDTGDPTFTPPPSTDQRGYPRVSNARIDIGSFEVQIAPTPTPTPPPCMVLYDQTTSAGSGGVVSQNFETVNNAYDAQAADDFVVPVMQNWMVQQVKVNGIYFNGPGPAASVNVTFYFDSANFPGAVVSGGTFNSLSMSDTAGSFTIPLPTSLVLTAGTYWVSVQANIAFNPFGEWAWSDRMVASNSPAVWQNPGGAFATSCTTYGRRGANCGIDPAAPDQIFQILGCTVATTPITVSGTVSYCSNPSPGPVPNVTLTLSGSASGMSSSNASGNYLFSVPSGGSYTVTPAKAARTPGSANINTVDVIATQRHFLNLGPPLSGCGLTAADVNGDSSVNTVDVIAIQRFFLGLSTGIANTGKYQFTPVNRTYTGIVGNQTGQNYDTLVFGDVAAPFVERVDGPSPPGR